MRKLPVMVLSLLLLSCAKQWSVTSQLTQRQTNPSRVLELITGDSFLLRFDRDAYNRFMVAENASCNCQVRYLDSLYPQRVVNLDTIYQTDFFLCNQEFPFIMAQLDEGRAEVMNLKTGKPVTVIQKTETYGRNAGRKKLQAVSYRTEDGALIYFHDYRLIIDF